MIGLENRVREIELTLENETNRNIKVIAEGHAFLNQKLDQILAIKDEHEMM